MGNIQMVTLELLWEWEGHAWRGDKGRGGPLALHACCGEGDHEEQGTGLDAALQHPWVPLSTLGATRGNLSFGIFREMPVEGTDLSTSLREKRRLGKERHTKGPGILLCLL